MANWKPVCAQVRMVWRLNFLGNLVLICGVKWLEVCSEAGLFVEKGCGARFGPSQEGWPSKPDAYELAFVRNQ